MVRALRCGNFLVKQAQACRMIRGDSKYAFFPAGTNDEIEISLVPRRGRLSFGHGPSTLVGRGSAPLSERT